MKAILIAAASSGAGKTTVTLALLRALRTMGEPVRSVKLGPDYIDPAFHAAATGRAAMNLDAWAMDDAMQGAIIGVSGPLVIESAMGLFDGAGLAGEGSAADVAKRFDIPILMVVDCARASHTVPAVVEGITQHRPGLRFHGLVLNNVGSPRHEALLRAAFDGARTPPILAVLRRDQDMSLSSRHLGLVQAQELSGLDEQLNGLAEWLSSACDPSTLMAEMTAPQAETKATAPTFRRISIAQDEAFSFIYPHILKQWREAGCAVRFFSPLADEQPPEADLIYLPGGYPELHAPRIAAARQFMDGIRNASRTTEIFGECGGYMVLGKALIDGDGQAHAMAGLLDVTTSFAERRLSLGYREVTAQSGPFTGTWRAHEFHYSTAVEERGAPLFQATDADGAAVGAMGLRKGRVSGSYAHLIAPRR